MSKNRLEQPWHSSVITHCIMSLLSCFLLFPKQLQIVSNHTDN